MVGLKMDMPVNCKECTLNVGGICVATEMRQKIVYDQRRQSWCPLRPVVICVSEYIVDNGSLEMWPEEVLMREARRQLRNRLSDAIIDYPDAVRSQQCERDESGIRCRMAARVVLFKEE